jgi:hypothetical protein
MCGVSFQQVFLDFRVPGRALEFVFKNKFLARTSSGNAPDKK